MTNEQQEEPGFGWYRDAEYDPWSSSSSKRGSWERGEEGWRWWSAADDEAPGYWSTWEAVKRYGPFTPIGDSGGVIAPHPEAVREAEARSSRTARETALVLAVQAAADEPITWESILTGARMFEAYLKGGE